MDDNDPVKLNQSLLEIMRIKDDMNEKGFAELHERQIDAEKVIIKYRQTCTQYELEPDPCLKDYYYKWGELEEEQ
jgi:hypothetical protein